MPNDQMTKLRDALVARFAADERALRHYEPDENPFANHDVKAMTNAGLLKQADRVPALDLTSKFGMAADMEIARRERQDEARTDLSAKRMQQARARAERKVMFDKIADSPVVPNPERMHQAWMVVMPLVPNIQKIAAGKARWAQRYLGGNVDDVPQQALVKLALMLAKSDHDLFALTVAANEIGEHTRSTGRIAGDQLSADEKVERKQIRKNRKLLMGMAHNRVMGALVDNFTSQRNLAEHNLDIIATVMASIGGAADSDPLFNSHKADRAPAFMGTRFQRPDGIDAGLLATAIAGAITDRGLDPLAEFMLDEEHRRVDGAVRWTEYAEHIFKLTPGGLGEHYWDLVLGATTGRRKDGSEWQMDRARKARGDAARTHVRNQFEFMPSLIVSIIESFDPHPIGFSSAHHRKVLASDWELFYAPAQPERREFLSPVLRYADATEAAEALLTHLSELVTGNDVVTHYINA